MSTQSTAKALPGKLTEADTVLSMGLNYTRGSIAITIIMRISKRLTSMVTWLKLTTMRNT